jgi:hypothetical protein
VLSRNFLAAIRDAVAETNAAIDAELAGDNRPGQLQALLSADHVASLVWARIFVTTPPTKPSTWA